VSRGSVALVALVLFTLAPLLDFVDASGAAVSDTTIHWRGCGHAFQCGSISVPVDYASPDGRQTRIAVTRQRALDPEHRIGSLVINFGGPGDPGTDTLRRFVAEVPKQIRERYDLVSFDPRGTGKSHPIDCIDDATTDKLLAVDPTPATNAALRAFYDGTEGGIDVVQACVDRYGSWLARLGSRNVARDLDLLRTALGERTLTYLGFSYGTVIGSVYAQQFPERVGRFVLDGPVDLSATSATDLDDSTAAFEHALDAFIAHCAHDHTCAFRSGGRPRAAVSKLHDRFERGLTLPAYRDNGRRSRRRAGIAAFDTAIVSALYDQDFGWPNLADALELATRGDGTLLQLLADSYNGRSSDGTYDSIGESSGLIVCADQPDPMESFESYVAEYDRAAHDYPFLGAFLTDVPLGCDARLPKPADNELLGDVRVSGVAPILVVGTTDDPATPYSGAQDLVGRIEGSRLLTFVSTEHTAYTKNTCINGAVDRYLLSGRLPREGTRCRR
jgi:pimeloyl-ACP methyl ester carboxylesterase